MWLVQKKFQQYKTIPRVVCNYWHTIQFSTRFRCEKGTVWFQLYMNRLENSTNGTKQTHTTQIPSWKVQNKPTPHQYRPEKIRLVVRDPRLGKPPHHDTPCGLPMHGMHGGVWNTDGCTEASRPSKTIARRSGILQRCVCFRTFVICFIPSCRLFIPLAFVSYPNELFSYLLQHFHTILVYFKTYGMQLVWLSTAIVFFHTLGICFIPKWPCFIPGARFSYLFGIQTKKHHDQKYLCSVWNESTA